MMPYGVLIAAHCTNLHGHSKRSILIRTFFLKQFPSLRRTNQQTEAKKCCQKKLMNLLHDISPWENKSKAASPGSPS